MNPTIDHSGTVYLVSPRSSALHKIGFTTNIEKRLAQLQTGSGTPLIVIKQWQGNPGLEKALHVKLARYRTQGEWFRFPKVVLRQLEMLDIVDVGAIRLPDYSNEAQTKPSLYIMVAARELAEIASGDTRELAEQIGEFARAHTWKSEADVDTQFLEEMVASLRLKGLRGREQKRFARIENSLKCLILWKDVELRWRIKYNQDSFRVRVTQLIADTIGDRAQEDCYD